VKNTEGNQFVTDNYMYASESVSLSASQLHSSNNCINKAVHKIFGVRNAESINDVRTI